jgi:DNA-binding PadR family transcriptional regulator
VAQAILRQTDDAILVEEGALYPALYRMESKGWLESEWGLSENNRRAKYYKLTPEGRKRLREEVKAWTHYAEAVGKVLSGPPKPQWERP